MTRIAMLATAAVMAISAGGAIAGGHHPTLSVKQAATSRPFVLPHYGLGILVDQRDNDNGVAIVSQNFEESFDLYDAQGADDFIVPKGKEWHVKEVDVDGLYFNGSGPATSYNVVFYKDNGGTPGKIADDCHNAAYTDAGAGSPAIPCRASFKGGKNGKRYWVSVQANMDFSAGGEWGWGTNNTVRGIESRWVNPGDGFATGCTTYTQTTTCIASGEGGDFSYALLGKVSQ